MCYGHLFTNCVRAVGNLVVGTVRLVPVDRLSKTANASLRHHPAYVLRMGEKGTTITECFSERCVRLELSRLASWG